MWNVRALSLGAVATLAHCGDICLLRQLATTGHASPSPKKALRPCAQTWTFSTSGVGWSSSEIRQMRRRAPAGGSRPLTDSPSLLRLATCPRLWMHLSRLLERMCARQERQDVKMICGSLTTLRLELSSNRVATAGSIRTASRL